MSVNLGQGALGLSPRTKPITAATVTAANNGISLSGTTAQLGQAVGAVGNPAILLNNREIPMGGFSFAMKSGANTKLSIDPTAEVFSFGQVDNVGNSLSLIIDDTNNTWSLGGFWSGKSQLATLLSSGIDLYFLDNASVLRLQFGDPFIGNDTKMQNSEGSAQLVLSHAANGALSILGDQGVISTTFLSVNPMGQVINFVAANGLTINATPGFTGTVSPVNSITVVHGIVTAVS